VGAALPGDESRAMEVFIGNWINGGYLVEEGQPGGRIVTVHHPSVKIASPNRRRAGDLRCRRQDPGGEMRYKKLRSRVAVRCLALAIGPIAFMASSCQTSDDSSSNGGQPTSGPSSTSGSTTAATDTGSTPDTSADGDTTIVAYQVVKESAADPTAIAITFTNDDGNSETETNATLPWQAGGFVPVGSDVSLKAETQFVELAPFSCTVRINGRSFVEQSQAVTEGNDIVGAQCEVGPITAESVVS
jgi:hypothetical protein